MNEHLIVRVVTKMLVPFVLLFALYVQMHGDFGPGGGFQAGVIFAAAFIVYAIVFGIRPTIRAMPVGVVAAMVSLGVILYAGVGFAALLAGGSFLDYSVFDPHDPVRGQHLGILLVELGVGITVSGVLMAIFLTFAERYSR
ncbi:MAG: Na(+)/H(+) antiporter subunit B [Dongiaceae bacterium]